MMDEALDRLFARYAETAVKAFDSGDRLLNSRRLSATELPQLNNWLRLNGEDEWPEGQVLEPRHVRGWLGYGIWHVDYLSEWISYVFVDSRYRPVHEKIEEQKREATAW